MEKRKLQAEGKYGRLTRTQLVDVALFEVKWCHAEHFGRAESILFSPGGRAHVYNPGGGPDPRRLIPATPDS